MPVKTTYDHERQADVGRYTIVYTITDPKRFRVYDGPRFKGWHPVCDKPRIGYIGPGLVEALRAVGAMPEARKMPTEPAPRDDDDTAPLRPMPKRKRAKKST